MINANKSPVIFYPTVQCHPHPLFYLSYHWNWPQKWFWPIRDKNLIKWPIRAQHEHWHWPCEPEICQETSLWAQWHHLRSVSWSLVSFILHFPRKYLTKPCWTWWTIYFKKANTRKIMLDQSEYNYGLYKLLLSFKCLFKSFTEWNEVIKQARYCFDWNGVVGFCFLQIVSWDSWKCFGHWYLKAMSPFRCFFAGKRSFSRLLRADAAVSIRAGWCVDGGVGHVWDWWLAGVDRGVWDGAWWWVVRTDPELCKVRMSQSCLSCDSLAGVKHKHFLKIK